MSGVLRATDLAVGRAGSRVLCGIDLELERGERLALLGSNGSGKTTLLRAFAGLDAPLDGTLSWWGGALPRGRERVRKLGVVFQSETPPAFSVRELVTLGLGLEGRASGPERRRVEAVLEWAGLGPLSDRACRSLSGGELRLALFARALAAGPELLLLDEPTNHLDPARKAGVLDWLERLERPLSVVIATHDLELAARADRVGLIGAGRMRALGAPREVLTPENLARVLGVNVRRLAPPYGGSPLLQIGAGREVPA